MQLLNAIGGRLAAVPSRSLRLRLLLLGLSIWGPVVVLIALGAILVQRAELIRTTENTLTVIAAQRAAGAQNMVHLAVDQLRVVAELPEVQAALNGEVTASAQQRLLTSREHMILPLDWLAVTSAAGDVLLHSGESMAVPDLPLEPGTGPTFRTWPGSEFSAPSFEVMLPLRDLDVHQLRGWIVARIGVDGLARFVTEPTGLGQTGQISWSNGAPTRGDGSRIQGAAAQVPGPDWVVVASIDRAEALRPLVPLVWAIGSIAVLMAALGALGALIFGNKLVQPLELLTRAATEMASGLRVDHLPVYSRDELGLLSLAFNRMSDAILSAIDQFRAIFEYAPIGMAVIDSSGKVTMANEALATMLGYTAEELRTHELLHHVDPAELPGCMERLAPLLAGSTDTLAMEVRCRHKYGLYVPVQVSVSLLRTPTEGAPSFVMQVQDIRERKLSEARLSHLADHDPLTDLLNRRRFYEELGKHLRDSTRHGAVGALMVMDLDNFKDVNDSFGHWAGDSLLVSIANLLRRIVATPNALARLGGDEFALILPGASAEAAAAAAQLILDTVRQHSVTLGGESVGVTASLGVALYPNHGLDPGELLICADDAMYAAKKQGRHDFAVYRPDRDRSTALLGRLGWENRIRRALQHDLFRLYAQPIQSLSTGAVAHYELLLRLEDGGDPVAPGEFLGVAERFGLIADIDRWVIREAIRQAAAFEVTGQDVTLEANLSARAFSDGALIPLIQEELWRTGINPSRLVLEITETAAIADFEQARRFICTLKAMGLRFALDDFGVGYASFDYLRQLPIDFLKIDGSFIRNVVNETVDQHLVKAMVAAAKGLQTQTIAEFVGDSATVGLLKEYGVDYAQGYHIGRPRPLHEVFESVA